MKKELRGNHDARYSLLPTGFAVEDAQTGME
jgi:hypothetical protein